MTKRGEDRTTRAKRYREKHFTRIYRGGILTREIHIPYPEDCDIITKNIRNVVFSRNNVIIIIIIIKFAVTTLYNIKNKE